MSLETLDNRHKVLIFTARELDRLELDSEDDFKDEITERLKSDSYVEVYSGWDYTSEYYVVIVRII